MGFLLFLVPLCVVFFYCMRRLLPSIVQEIVNIVAKPSDEEINLKAELCELNKELKVTNMVDEFAKYAKIERKINKISDQLKLWNKEKSGTQLKVQVGVNAVFHIAQLASFLSLIYTYRHEPLLNLPPEWFWPVSSLVAFPTGVSGAVSITFWLVVCRTIVNRVASTFINA